MATAILQPQALSTPTDVAVCSCGHCDGATRPTAEMLKREGRWFCSEEAYADYWAFSRAW